MNNLFNPADTTGILNRLEKLSPDAQKQWGKMNIGQMLAHCSASLETAMGRNTPKKLNILLRLMGKLMKAGIVSEKPMSKSMPTDKSYIMTGEYNFEQEKNRVMELIRTFSQAGPEKCTTAPQVFFGHMTPTEWATMQWKHFDHHLRQFGA